MFFTRGEGKNYLKHTRFNKHALSLDPIGGKDEPLPPFHPTIQLYNFILPISTPSVITTSLKMCVVTGDCGQIFSGTRADVVQASLKCSELWKYVEILPPLRQNIRLNTTSQEFNSTLLKIGT